jgi:hypothetical protein
MDSASTAGVRIENTVDNLRFLVFFRGMASSDQRLVTRTSLAVDAVLVGAFFVLMFTVVRPHVPSHEPLYTAIWAGLTSACLSSVFWLAVQMFRVVYRAQKAAKK